MHEQPTPSFSRGLWILAAVFAVAAVVAAAIVHPVTGDGLDHLNSARWLWRGQQWTRFIDHRPPTLTLLLVPLAFAYEFMRLDAETTLRCCRLLSALALTAAAVGVARGLPGWAARQRPVAALAVASSPLLLALAPVFSQDACAAGGVGLVFWLQRRLHESSSRGRCAALILAAGAVALLRYDTGAVLVGLAAGELWSRAPRKRTAAVVLGAGATTAALFVLLMLLRFGADGLVDGVRQTFLDAADAVANRPEEQFGAAWLYGATWLRTAGPLLLLLAAWGAREAVVRRDPVGVAALVSLAVWGFEFGVLVSNDHPRYMGQLIPAAILLAALGLEAACRRIAAPAGRRALVVAALAWPVLLGAVELWAFGDPAYLQPAERRMTTAVREVTGGHGRVWQVGGNFVLRPERRAAFVAGDVSTRTHTVGVGGLNFRLRQPILSTQLEPNLWQTLLPLGHGDVALVFGTVDHRAWPLQRSETGRLIQVERADLAPTGDGFEGDGLRARIDGDDLVIASARDLGVRTVVTRGPDGAARSLGARRIAGETRLPWPGGASQGLVLLGGVSGPPLRFTENAGG